MSAAQFHLPTLLGDKLLSGEDNVNTTELEGKTVALYFSAKWCPPCKVFTPILAAARTAALSAGHSFEVVFVSSDSDEEGFTAYYGGEAMRGWRAVPFEDTQDLRQEIKNAFGCKGIPQLSVLQPSQQADGSWAYALVTNDGKSAVTKDKEQAIVGWCSASSAAPGAASAATTSPTKNAPAPAADAFTLDADF